jgi:hypothetical protein
MNPTEYICMVGDATYRRVNLIIIRTQKYSNGKDAEP